jgi:GTP pyrophosphokinase
VVPSVDRLLHGAGCRCTSCTSRCLAASRTISPFRKLNGYQSLHTTLVGPIGRQRRVPGAHRGHARRGRVRRRGALAVQGSDRPETPRRLDRQWLQSLLDIQDETRDAAEFWDHVKVDLFPDAVYVFTPKSQIMALPRGATRRGLRLRHPQPTWATAPWRARVNGEQVPLRTELKNGDMIEVVNRAGI